jgi:membrane-associated phospholipid phosphatase
MQQLCVPPGSIDRAVARTAARYTSPSIQKVARLATWAGDKHLLIALAAAHWLGSRRQGARRRVQADHLLSTVVFASVVPGLLKSVIDQERPDRCMVGPERKGIETSGKARDAFPSGHAVNMGATASALAWIYPDNKSLFWGLAAAITSTRVAILAHWASDVVVGAALGAGLEEAARQVANRRLRALPERPHHD